MDGWPDWLRRDVRNLLLGGCAAIGFAHPAVAQTAGDPTPPLIVNPAPTTPFVAVPVPPPGAQLPLVEPIIPDAEFGAAIPPLSPTDDPALSGPLESVAEFERRIAGEGAASVVASGTAPLGDPELDLPLPPLSQFDVRAIEFAAPAVDSGSVQIGYATRLEGLDKADLESDFPLKGRFNALSALRDGKGKAANEAMLSARLTEDSKLLERVLHAEGWYDAKVAARIDQPTVATSKTVTAVLVVVPGERYKFATIKVDAAPTVPPGLIEKNLALKAGEPIIAERVQGAEANISIVLPQEGYAFAEVGQRDILLDPETRLGDYTLPVTVGPRVRIGGYRTAGKLAFDARHVEVLSRFKRGDLYDSRKVDDLRQALVATGLFSTIAVVAERTGAAAAADGTETVELLVTQQAGPRRTLAASAGYGTGQGLRVEGSWTNRNFSRPEGALIATAVAGTAEQGASLTFRRSNAGKRDRTVQFTAEALRSNYDAFTAFTGRLSGRMSYDSTPIWQKKFTWAVGAEVLGTIEKAFDPVLGVRDSKKYLIGSLLGQVGFDRSDSLLDPTKGFRATILVQPEGSLQGGFTPYVRGQFDGSAYYPVAKSIVVAGRVRVGSIVNIARDDLAPSRRFYAGGGGSVRGYSYQGLGPKDPNNDPLGGLSLVEGAAEVRYRFGDYGVVGFVDAGQVSDKRMPSFSNLRAGVGIGGRFYTNFGPLRLDVATPVGRKKGESRLNVYVSIGQAF